MAKFDYGSEILCVDFHLHTQRDKEFKYVGEENAYSGAFGHQSGCIRPPVPVTSGHPFRLHSASNPVTSGQNQKTHADYVVVDY